MFPLMWALNLQIGLTTALPEISNNAYITKFVQCLKLDGNLCFSSLVTILAFGALFAQGYDHVRPIEQLAIEP